MSKDLNSRVLVADAKAFVNAASEEDARVLAKRNRAELVGNRDAVKTALKDLKVPFEIRKAVLNGYYAKEAKAKGVYDAFMAKKYEKRFAIKNLFLEKRGDEVGGTMPYVHGFKIQEGSEFLDALKAKNGVTRVASGIVDAVAVETETGLKMEGGYMEIFGKKVEKPIAGVISVDLSKYGDEEAVQEVWKDIHQNGLLYDGRNLYRNTPENRVKNSRVKLFIVCRETDSGRKEQSFMMCTFSKDSVDESYEELVKMLVALDNRAPEFLAETFCDGDEAKALKRIFSMSCCSGKRVGEIDLTQYKILIKKTPWRDDSDIDESIKDKIPAEVLDGMSIIKGSFWSNLLNAFLKVTGSCITVGGQMRTDAIAGKTYVLPEDDAIFEEHVKTAEKDPDYAVIGNPKGECVLIGDSNAFKLFNNYMKFVEQGGAPIEKLGIFLMNMTHTGKMQMNLSAQISNKFDDRDAYNELVRGAVAEEHFAETNAILDGNLDGSPLPKKGTLLQMMYSVLGKDAKKYTLVQKELIMAPTRKNKKYLEKGNVPVAGTELAVSMDQDPVISPDKFFKVLTTDKSVYEIYSSSVLKNHEKLFSDSRNFEGTAIKYPSQGRDEFLVSQFVTLEELAVRVALKYSMWVKEGEMSLKEASKYAEIRVRSLKFRPEGDAMLCNTNLAAAKLAGFDKDFDHIVVYTHKKLVEMFKDKLDKKGWKGVATIIDIVAKKIKKAKKASPLSKYGSLH